MFSGRSLVRSVHVGRPRYTLDSVGKTWYKIWWTGESEREKVGQSLVGPTILRLSPPTRPFERAGVATFRTIVGYVCEVGEWKCCHPVRYHLRVYRPNACENVECFCFYMGKKRAQQLNPPPPNPNQPPTQCILLWMSIIACIPGVLRLPKFSLEQ